MRQLRVQQHDVFELINENRPQLFENTAGNRLPYDRRRLHIRKLPPVDIISMFREINYRPVLVH